MRLICTLISFLVLSFTAGAQNLTGIWRGYFSSSNGLYREGIQDDVYKYEIQIDQQSNNSLEGVTYSYRTTVFYGKAEFKGIYTAQAKTLILKEIRLVELKIGDKSDPCLMTCYLDYSRMGKLEVLQGTFISMNVKTKNDCGSGKIYLERVPTSDFKKEDFLLKKKEKEDSQPVTRAVPPPVNKPAITIPKTAPPAPQRNNGKVTKRVVPQTNKAKPPVKQTPPVIALKKPPVKDNTKAIITKPIEKISDAPVVNNWKADSTISSRKETAVTKIPPPKVLLERENNLVKTIYTDEESIKIEIYDNGTIDHDTISLYDNNELLVSRGGLSYTPITVKVKCSKESPRHEFIMVAENLGEIPPNSAMMVITTGNRKERYEVFLTSNEQRNAKLVIEYRAK